jgi:hypothetical protein
MIAMRGFLSQTQWQKMTSLDSKVPQLAYDNSSFLNSVEARPLRILAEYLEPRQRFGRAKVHDTIVFLGRQGSRPMVQWGNGPLL